MKRTVSVFISAVLLFTLCSFSCSADNAPRPEVDPEKAASFGLANVVWTDEPQTLGEFERNFMLSFLANDWDYLTDLNIDLSKIEWSGDLNSLVIPYASLFGYFMNQNRFFAICIDGKYYIATAGIEPTLSKEEISEQIDTVYQTAKAIANELRESAKITDDMTEAEKCKVYYDYLFSLSIKPSSAVGNIDYHSRDDNYRTIYMKYDSAYAALVDRIADCGGRAAAYSLLLNLDGIASYGIQGQMKGTDTFHILNYIILDGEEYFSDYGNALGIEKIDSSTMINKFEASPDSLAIDRRLCGLADDEDITDYFIVHEFRETAADVFIPCSVKESFQSEDTMYRVSYGVEGNCTFFNDIPVDALKQQVIEFGLSKQIIAEHNIPPVIRVEVAS